ncbi:MAG: class I SAM-dependent methyltransferase [Archaeoglobus sp.]|nr:class I SAM-dependent methyltransferase [Archaeoglobus sp.]
MDSIEVFEKHAQKYDEWFEENKFVYESELLALKKFIPEGRGLEVGVGTGRFAAPLGIRIGVEPAKAMAEIARKRGIEVYEAKAEMLPFDDFSFDFVLIVVTICFVQDPIQTLKEAKRVLKHGGWVIIGIIDKESFLGKLYEKKKEKSVFYSKAKFYSAREVINWLEELGFKDIRTCQTIFKDPRKVNSIEPVREGYGEGGFVVIAAQK